MRHHLFDIRFFVVRALAYGSTLMVVSFVFLFPVIYILTKVLDVYIATSKIILILFIAPGLIIVYGYIRSLLDKTTARIFFRNEYNPEQFIAELNSAIVSSLEVRKLLTDAAAVIAMNLRADYCLFVLHETEEVERRFIGVAGKTIHVEDMHKISSGLAHIHDRVVFTEFLGNEHAGLQRVLRANDIAALARLRPNENSEEELGYIFLGSKKSGQQYSTRDIRTLGPIIDSLIIAIQNALRFEQIEQFSATLQERVNTATRKLQRTNEKLKALDETKDEFISMASHQLRTPLTSIKGYISMVMEGDGGEISDTQREMLGQAFFSSQRMVYLIADLLNVSRLKTGKFIIDAAPVNLAEVIGQELGQLKETAASRQLTLTYDQPKDFPKLMLDETKTRQVIMNFIDNAIYYTPAGGKITIGLKETPSSIEFTCTDNGIGVPKSEQPHMFTKFYRAGNARKARPDGTGLGLFMAKKVVVAQGGSIVFKSQENKGSTFGFIFAKAKLAVPKDYTPTRQGTALLKNAAK